VGGISMEKKIIHTENGVLYYWVGGNQNIDARCVVFVHGNVLAEFLS